MFSMLCPNQVAESVLDINLSDLSCQGIKGLILDLDNTLLGWDAAELSPQMRDWVSKARRYGFGLCIASNGLNTRVRTIADLLTIPAIAKATKPRKRPFRLALELLDVAPQQAAVVGDQIFTDILGGNRMDIYTILINPISRKELGTTRMVRCVERRVLCYLQKRGLLQGAALHVRLGARPGGKV